MTDKGVVYDLGYKPHDGPRLGRSAAIRATIRDGLRRMFGIRRRARKKILPWMLFIIALLPAIVFVGLVFLTLEAIEKFAGQRLPLCLADPDSLRLEIDGVLYRERTSGQATRESSASCEPPRWVRGSDSTMRGT